MCLFPGILYFPYLCCEWNNMYPTYNLTQCVVRVLKLSWASSYLFITNILPTARGCPKACTSAEANEVLGRSEEQTDPKFANDYEGMGFDNIYEWSGIWLRGYWSIEKNYPVSLSFYKTGHLYSLFGNVYSNLVFLNTFNTYSFNALRTTWHSLGCSLCGSPLNESGGRVCHNRTPSGGIHLHYYITVIWQLYTCS